MAKQSTTRETKAVELIQSGAVTLYVGQGYAEIKGSGRNVYRVTSTGCTCKDFERRGVDCKHRISARLLCEEFKACKAAAQRGETIRLSSALVAAVRWPEKPKATATGACKHCGAPTDFDVCSGCFFGNGPKLNAPVAA